MMSDEFSLTIGRLAALSGVTAETIRYYEREGVIPRAKRSGPGRYRCYERADADRLRFVRRARSLGFSLEDVRRLLELAESVTARPCRAVNGIAHEHLAKIDAMLARLAARRAELAGLIESCDSDAAATPCSLLQRLHAGDVHAESRRRRSLRSD